MTKLDVDMSHDEFRKPIYFGVRRSNVKVTSRKNIACVGAFALL